MTKTNLSDADRKINITDYTLREYALYLSSFQDKVLVIKTNSRTLNVVFSADNMPHLIGFQYAFDKRQNIKNYRGRKGMNLMLSGDVSFKNIEENIKKNRVRINKKLISWDEDIKPRIEWLPYFLNTVKKKSRLKIVDKTKVPHNLLQGNYYYFKNDRNDYLILSLLEFSKTSTPETFIVNNGIRFLANSEEEEITSVHWEMRAKKRKHSVG